jgi:hypothetical protein
VSTLANRYPILNRAAVVAVVGVAVAALRHYGVVIPDAESGAVVDLVTVGGPLVLAVWAARHVTPVADPKTAQLVPLVPATPAPVKATAPAQVLVPATTAGVPALSAETTSVMPAITAPANAWDAFTTATQTASE